MQETWRKVIYKDVKTDMYMVSNLGKVKNVLTDTELHPWTGNNGYLYVALMGVKNKPIKIGVHVLVATMFIPIPNKLLKLNEPIVPNHDDFDKTNNTVANLRWMTYAMNNEWNYIHGHCKVGEQCQNAKVSDELVETICGLMEKGYLNKDILHVLSLPNDRYHKALLTSIRTGKHWKHISSKYNIINKNTLRKNTDEFVDSICKLIEKGYSVKEMREILNIPNTDTEKARFKKLVWFIRTRKCYKDISSKYKW